MLKSHVPNVPVPSFSKKLGDIGLIPHSRSGHMRIAANLNSALVLCPFPMAYRASGPSVTCL